MTRPLLEHVVRRRVSLLENVILRDDVTVERVEVSKGRVSGVVVDGALQATEASSSTAPVGPRASRTSSTRRESSRRPSVGC